MKMILAGLALMASVAACTPTPQYQLYPPCDGCTEGGNSGSGSNSSTHH